MGKSVIYTAGHSNHSIEVFLELLKTVSVNCLIDVGSMAASAYNPQYHKQGLDKGCRMALMCSEGDPFDGHRFSMISVALEKDGFEAKHILKDKLKGNIIKTTTQLEIQPLKKYEKKIPPPDMFQNVTLDEQLQAAYRLRNKEIAFSPYSKQPAQEHD